MPRSRAILQQRIASITTPAEFGLSQTSSLTSRLSTSVPQLILDRFQPGGVGKAFIVRIQRIAAGAEAVAGSGGAITEGPA